MKSCLRVLQVVENFSQGGVEEHILAVSRELERRGHCVTLAVGNEVSDSSFWPLTGKVHSGLAFWKNIEQTVGGFLNDVNRLSAIMREEEIDVVLVHPFYSLFAPLAAAKLLNIPAAYVLHGPTSATFAWTSNVNALYQYSVAHSLDHVFYVGQGMLPNAITMRGTSSLLRNPCFGVKGRDHTSNFGHRWALASRMDHDKIGGVLRFIEWLPHLAIDRVDVFGDGDAVDAVLDAARSYDVVDRLQFHGYDRSWLLFAIEHDYGVIGYGRVALEAICSELPVLMLSKDEYPCGILERSMLELSVDDNFSGRNLGRLAQASELESQLQKLYSAPFDSALTEMASGYFSVEVVVDSLLEVFSRIRAIPDPSWLDYLAELKGVEDQSLPLLGSNISAQLIQCAFDKRAISWSAHSAIVLAAQIERDSSAATRAIGEFSNNLSETVSALVRMQAQTAADNKEVRDSLSNQALEIKAQQAKTLELEKSLTKLKTSYSWRIGRIVTYIPRLIRNWLKRFVN